MPDDRITRERDLFHRLLLLGRTEEFETFLSESLQLIVEVTGARLAYLELRAADSDDEHAFRMSAGCSPAEEEEIQDTISRGIIAEAIASGETIATHSALLDARFEARESVQRGRIEGVVCAPIGAHGAQGVVYIQGGEHSNRFAEEDREAVELFAEHLAPLSEHVLVQQRGRTESDAMRDLRSRYELGGLVGRSQGLARAVEQAMLAAPLDVAMLISGPSGTGKTQLARLIHANSRRAKGPFVELNCAALPPALIESELFGARAGAHSTATTDTPGKVVAAEGGTLFLDEIGELPIESQPKLLQLLQSHTYYRLGDSKESRADVRIIAASNVDFEEAVEAGRFRQDLFFRLNVLPVRLPGLSERPEDIEELARALAESAAARHGLPALPISANGLRAVRGAEWPGNVRQLENTIEAALIRAAGAGLPEISESHLFPERAAAEPEDAQVEVANLSFQEATRRFQHELLERTLEQTDWNVSEASRQLDIGRSTIYELMSGFGMSRKKRTTTSRED